MAVAVFLAGTAQGHALQQGDVVADDGGFADHHAGAVVQHHALADARGRVDVGAGDFGDAVLQEQRQGFTLFAPQPVGDALALDGVEALEIQQRGGVVVASRIAVETGADVGARRR